MRSQISVGFPTNNFKINMLLRQYEITEFTGGFPANICYSEVKLQYGLK